MDLSTSDDNSPSDSLVSETSTSSRDLRPKSELTRAQLDAFRRRAVSLQLDGRANESGEGSPFLSEPSIKTPQGQSVLRVYFKGSPQASSVMWRPDKVLSKILQRICDVRGVDFEQVQVRDSENQPVDTEKTLGELGIFAVLVVDQSTSAKRRTLQKTKALTAKLDEHMLRPEGAADDVTALQDVIQSRSPTKREPVKIFGATLEELSQGKLLPPFIYTAFTRLIDEASTMTSQFRIIETFVLQLDKVASLPVARRALERGDVTLEEVPDLRSVTSLLLAYFRTQPDPLFPPHVTKVLVRSRLITDVQWRRSIWSSYIQSMSPLRRDTLYFILTSLNKLLKLDASSDARQHLCRCVSVALFRAYTKEDSVVDDDLGDQTELLVIEPATALAGSPEKAAPVKLQRHSSLSVLKFARRLSSPNSRAARKAVDDADAKPGRKKKRKTNREDGSESVPGSPTPRSPARSPSVSPQVSPDHSPRPYSPDEFDVMFNSSIAGSSKDSTSHSTGRPSGSSRSSLLTLDSDMSELLEVWLTDVESIFKFTNPSIALSSDPRAPAKEGAIPETPASLSSITLDEIFVRLADPLFFEPHFKDTILVLYSYFATPLEFCKQLLAPEEKSTSAESLPAWQLDRRKLILQTLYQWVGLHRRDVATDKEVMKLLNQLALKLPLTTNESAIATTILSLVKARLRTMLDSDLFSQESVTVRLKITTTVNSQPIQLASQVALLNLHMLQQMDVSELLHRSWMDAAKGPTFAMMTDHFVRLSDWVQTWIVNHEDVNKRRQWIAFFLAAASELLNIGDLNGAMCFYMALNASSVSRLKQTWCSLSKPATRHLNLLTNLFHVERNYRRYREILNQRSDVIPCISLVTKDLFALEENVPSILHNPDQKMINYSKLRILFDFARQLRRFQRARLIDPSSGQPLAKNDGIYAYLYHVAPLRAEELYALSCNREGKKKEISAALAVVASLNLTALEGNEESSRHSDEEIS